MKTSLKFIALLVLFSLTLAACGSNLPVNQESPQPVDTEPAAPPTDVPVDPTDSGSVEDDGTAPESDPKTFTILPAESEVRFIINEILFGTNTAISGITNQVEGSITADYQNPAAVSINPITIDLTTLATDNPNRNRAMHNSILETGAYPTGTFEATGVSGLPETVTIGEPFNFQITGNLTVHGVTKELTFDTTATAVSETRLEGLASVQIVYQDFGINILRLPPQVASVEDEVILEIEFAAEAQ